MNTNYPEHNQDAIFDFGIDDTAQSHMMETARWGKFLAIVGFIGMGILVVISLFALAGASALSRAMGTSNFISLFIVYFVLAAVYFYPTFALFKFSQKLKPALAHRNQQLFNEAMGYLKNMFRYIGIVVIIMLVIYGLLFIFGVFAAVIRS